MKRKIFAIIMTFSFVLSLFIPFSASASDKSYSEGNNKDIVYSESTNDTGLNGSLDNIDSLISVDSHHLKSNRVVSKAMLTFADSNNAIEHEYVINADCAYDYVSVIYLSTEGVTLNSKSYQRTISDDTAMTISFTPCNPFIGQSTKNVYDYQEDKVIMNISFWNDNEIECTDAVEISILYTPFGTFFSEIDPILSRRNYSRYLLSNGIIDKATYEELNATFHCFSEDASSEIELNLAEFDTSLSSQDQVKLTSAITDKYSISNNDAATLVTQATKSDYAEVIYNIQSLNNGDQLRVYGYVYWYGTSSTANTSGKKYPAQYVNVDIIDQDVAFDDLIATVKTSSSGYFSYTFDNQSIEGGRDIYLKVYSGNDDTMVYDFGSFDFFASGILGPLISYNIEPYYFTTAVTSDITTSKSNLEGYSPAGSLISKSFSIGNALYYAREYEKYINGGSTLNNITVKLHYPLPIIETSFTLPVLDMGTVMLDEDDYADWGTIMHEYGHAVADKLEIFVGYLSLFSKHGFNHVAKYNLTDYYEGNKNKALKISWNEGWASYYSLCVQRKFSLQSTGFPKASNTSIWGYDIVNNAFYGEDNELAIAATMINLITQNIFTESELWNIIKTERPQSFHELNTLVIDEILSNAASTTLPESELNKFFSILEKQNISAETAATNVGYSASSFGPTFSWLPPETYSQNPNGTTFTFKYQVAILSTDPVYIYQSPQISSTSYTIPSDVWAYIIENCTNGFYWTIITDEVTAPASGGYYSKIYAMDYESKSVTIPAASRYKEYQETIGVGKCIDYKVKFNVSGTQLIQTFGTLDTVLELYSMDGTLLLGRIDTDDDGYSRNALFTYNFTANTEYIVRIRFYSSSTSGTIKLAIAPTYNHDNYEAMYGPYSITKVGWSLSQNRVAFFRYQFNTSGNVTFTMDSEEDTYIYFIDPSSSALSVAYTGNNQNAACLYDDDSGTDFQAQLTKYVQANKEYIVIISFYNPNTTSGEFSITTTTS